MTDNKEVDPATRLLVAIFSYVLTLTTLLAGVALPLTEPGTTLWEKICFPIAAVLVAGWLVYKLRASFHYLAYRLDKKLRRKKK